MENKILRLVEHLSSRSHQTQTASLYETRVGKGTLFLKSRQLWRYRIAARIGTAMLLLAQRNSSFAQTWIQTAAPSQFWQGIASSAYGGKLVAAAYSDATHAS